VFRLSDPQTGQAREVTPGPGGLMRLYARARGAHRPMHVGDLRSLLLADLIGRHAELYHHAMVWMVLGIPDEGRDAADAGPAGDAGPGGDDPLGADLAALNLRPAERTFRASSEPGTISEMIMADGRILIDVRGAGPDIWQDSATGLDPVQPWARWVSAGPVLFEGREMDATVPPLTLSGLSEHGLDPLALRMAFLASSYSEPVDLTWGALTDADLALRRWREGVAEWAESASQPMSEPVITRVRRAFDDDLDTPAALRALGELERDPGVPPGSKFETFARADQLLALDLPRDIGRAPVTRNNSSS
jgi:cysteinyl-tRNA synthetase